MSSSEFKTIYNNASAIVRARLSERLGIEKLLSELGRRMPDSEKDPRQNRELFFEPRIDAQQIGVPVETAEAAAVLLHRMGVLRVWVRVICPDMEEHEVGTVLETDDPGDFERLVSNSCNYCGRHHDLGWDNCETVYALNTRCDQDEQHFDYSRLRTNAPSSQKARTGKELSDAGRCEILSQQLSTGTSPQSLLMLALRSNQRTQEVPAPVDVWLNAWAGPSSILIGFSVFIIPITKFCGERLAWLVTFLVFGVVFLVIRGQVQAKLAPTAVQRTAMYLGFPISACCITAGATGLHIKAEAGEVQPWWTRFEFGEQSTLLISSGVFLFISVLVFVWAFDFSRGWLTKRVTD